MLRRILTLASLLVCIAACQRQAHAQAPAPPTAVEARTYGSTQILVAWNAVASATSYHLYQATSSGAFTSTYYTITTPTTHLRVTGLNDPQAYFFVVKAVNASGEGTASTQVSASSGAAQLPAPASLTATASDSQAALTWSPIAGATSYDIYRTPLTPSNDASIYVSQVSGTSYTDTGLADGTTYTYQVAAVEATGEGQQST